MREHGMTEMPAPESIAPVKKRRTYILFTGLGETPQPRLLTCADVMQRELGFLTSACGCVDNKCTQLMLEPPRRVIRQ